VSLRLFGIAVLLLGVSLHAEVAIVASGELPASTKDSSGDTVGGIGSAVAYDERTGCVFLMPDRGAGDGTIAYRPRCYRMRLSANPKNPARLDTRIEETIFFRDNAGRFFTGLLPDNAAAPSRGGRRCLDPEAIAIAPDGSLYITDEYSPALLHFDRSGKLLREYPLPHWCQPRNRAGDLDYRSPPHLSSGRTENQGPEAMGLLPGGKRAVLIFQSALAQDGGKLAGTARILVLDLRSGRPVAEYAYPFGPAPVGFADLSVNDLAVVDALTLLVLERDGRGRNGSLDHPSARYKAVWLVDLRDATNLLSLRDLPYNRAPSDKAFLPLTRSAGVRFVKKTHLFNLPDLLPSKGLAARDLAAKWEGLCLLPSSEKRSLRLLLTADNDFLHHSLSFDGITTRFPRAQDSVPTQFFEILASRP
jgi:hypothetical protein